MPRIDPSQLLRTLSVLLAKDGGIRSAEEVPRIVQLMQKFSKKLVSKCIYIHILCSSNQELLESFLSQKGWDLLNMWFSDAIKNQNYFLCGDLVKLFAVCPMNPARLKENVEINQAPKLIRQLSCDTRIEETVRHLSLQVLQQWMSVIRAPPNLQISNAVTPNLNTNGSTAGNTEHSSKDLNTLQDQPVKVAPRTKVSPPKKPSPTKEKKRHNVIDSSDSEDNFDNDDSKDYNPSESDMENGKPFKASNPAVKKLKKDASKDDSTDVDDLLGGDSTSEDERRHMKGKDEKSKNDVVSEASIKKKRDEKDKEREKRDKEREKEREERRIKERERERRKAQERKDKAKPYSRTELRNSLDSSDKERIKEVAKKLKEESGASQSAGLGRIPKIVKPGTDKDDKKKIVSSFADMLGEIDVKKAKPKAPPIKNKNKDLLDSITNPSPIKPKAKFDSKSVDEKLRKDKDKEKERRNSFSNKTTEGEKKLKSDKIETKETQAKTTESTEKEKLPERPKPKIVIPEKTAEKRSYKDASPKVETKKSPSVIKESSFFGDVLGDIMKEPPRKKKRRPSDVKPEKEVTEVNGKAKEVTDKEMSHEETEEKMETSENGEELAFAEPTSDLPREVRGILVYAKGNKAKKKIQWKPEDKLVEIEYFEVDETERENVWKKKTFEEMKKKEASFEKMKFSTGIGSNINGDEEVEEAPKVWKLIILDFDGETLEGITKLWEAYGTQSDEKAVQGQRELRVLKSLFFNQIPCDPSEPDPGSSDKSGEEPKEIPPVDLSDNKDDSSYDYSLDNWPIPESQKGYIQPQAVQPPPISTNSINALLKDINPKLLASLPPPHIPPPDHISHQPPPSLNSADAKLFAAQKAAAEALAATPYLSTPPPGMGGTGPPHNHNGFPGYQPGYQDRGGQRGHDNYERGYKGGNSNYHNNHYNKNYKGRDGRDNREDHRDDHRDRGYRDRQQDYKRPCKFWMDRGKCKDEDRCMYPHPSR